MGTSGGKRSDLGHCWACSVNRSILLTIHTSSHQFYFVPSSLLHITSVLVDKIKINQFVLEEKADECFCWSFSLLSAGSALRWEEQTQCRLLTEGCNLEDYILLERRLISRVPDLICASWNNVKYSPAKLGSDGACKLFSAHLKPHNPQKLTRCQNISLWFVSFSFCCCSSCFPATSSYFIVWSFRL